MKIAIAQQNYHIGNFEANFSKMKMGMLEGKAQGADLVVFSELSICGYSPRDFLEFQDFINGCEAVIEQIKEVTKEIGIAAIVGVPTVNPVIEGKDLFNSAYCIAEGEIVHVAHKALLPTYDIFDEYRYFEPASTFEVFEFMGKRIALTVCEDIWNIANENPLYTICPMDELMPQHPDLMINISASPFSYDHAADRMTVVRANVERYGIPMIYCNATGAHTEVIFDGGSLVINDDAKVVDELPYFKETVQTYEVDTLIKSAGRIVKDQLQDKSKMDLIYQALLLGIQDYFGKLGFKKAILGLSGGIDSAITCVLACHALGAENVMAVMMPSQFSSDHSISDSEKLVKNLGCLSDTVPIQPAFEVMQKSLATQFEGLPFNVTEENLQARVRGNFLMALSNKFGYIVLNTSNKSEAAVGYGTLYGDMCGGLSVIGDVYKTEVFELCRWINRNGEIIPENIITKPPSAELRPNQKDSDSLPDYAELDAVLYQYIELRKGPKEIVAMGFEEALVKRVLRLVNINEYKRYQTAPMLRVSDKAFGIGRRMPIVGKYLS
ncbi:MAG: NAD+ synthase [Chitinophagales bacterium]